MSHTGVEGFVSNYKLVISTRHADESQKSQPSGPRVGPPSLVEPGEPLGEPVSRPVSPQGNTGRERRGHEWSSIENVPFVYVLECADGSPYVGSIRNLEKRVWEHETGLGAMYPANRRPVRLV